MADDPANAGRMLSRAAERLTTQVMTTVESIPSSSAVEPTASGSSRVEMELKSLFPHHFHQPSNTSSRLNATLNNPQRGKKRKAKGSEGKTKKCKIITRKFLCLSDMDQSEIPDAEEQRELLMAGLGEVKISVPEESNEMKIRDLVIETFPKLMDAGGFELMYAQPRKRDLRIIPPGPNGLTIKYFVSFIGEVVCEQMWSRVKFVLKAST